MKSKLSATDYATLSDALKAEYDLDGASGNYFLKIEGTTGADHPLFKARDNEKDAKENALRERDTARTELKTLKEKPPENESAADKARREAFDAEKKQLEDTYKAQLQERDAALHEVTVKQETEKLAGEMFTKPSRDSVHLSGRIKVEVKDGKAEVLYLDKDGKGTTRDALRKEYLANPDFKGITVASQASGGGAPPPNGGQGGGAPKPGDSQGAAPSYMGLDSKSLVAAMEAKGVGAGAEGTAE